MKKMREEYKREPSLDLSLYGSMIESEILEVIQKNVLFYLATHQETKCGDITVGDLNKMFDIE